MSDKYHGGVPHDRLPALDRGVRKAINRRTFHDPGIGNLAALAAALGARMVFDDATLVPYPAEARLFAEDLNEYEAFNEGLSVVTGCMITPGTTAGTLKLNVGYAVFDGLLKAVPGTGGSYVLTDNIAFVAAGGVVDATNPRWVLVELTSALAINLNPGTASTTPEVPNRTAGNIVLAKVYVPANASTVEALAANSSVDGAAKIHDMRRLRRLNESRWIPDLTGYTAGAPSTLASATLQPWVRVSGTQFTISSATDYSGRFVPGTRVRWSETGVAKYGTVASSSFAASTTTVNLFATTDYSMAATPDANSCFFCDGGTVPADFPDWFNFTPTYTGFTGSVTSTLVRFKTQGRQCTVAATTISGTSNALTFWLSLPVNAVANSTWLPCACRITDNGAVQGAAGQAVVNSTGQTIQMTKSWSSIPGNGDFTTSGTKSVNGLLLSYQF